MKIKLIVDQAITNYRKLMEEEIALQEAVMKLQNQEDDSFQDKRKENGKLFDFNSSFATFLPSGHYKPLEPSFSHRHSS